MQSINLGPFSVILLADFIGQLKYA